MKCGEKTEVYSRVVGYFRPVANWNKGKREEFLQRKTYLPQTPVKPISVVVSHEVMELETVQQ